MSAHARLGPSNKRWPKCAGSVREEADYPDIPGEAAIDGTGSHELLEMCLKNGVTADAYIDQIICVNHEDNPGGWLIGEDRAARVNMCLDYVDRRVKELQAQFPQAVITVESESKSDPGGMYGRDDWWGTVDITIIARDKMTTECLFIEVIDYKDGRGWVGARDNSQLLPYLGGKMRPYIAVGEGMTGPLLGNKVGGCRVTIVQPKTNPVIRSDDELSPMAAIQAVDKLSIAAIATDDPNAPLTPGKHCQWCKANPKRGGHCTAESEQSLATVENMSTEITTGDGQSLFEVIGQMVANPTILTADQLADLADARAGLMAAFDKVDAEIERRITDLKEHIPGNAMLPGKSSQAYNESDEKIAKALKGRRMKKDQIYPGKLITPAALLKSDFLTAEQKESFKKKYITSIASNKLSLKKVAREKVELTPVMMFGDLIEGEVVATEPVSFF